MLSIALRTIASLFLAVVICVSLLAYLASSKVRTTLLEPSFYIGVLEENDSYNTIREGLLTEAEEREELASLRNRVAIKPGEFRELAGGIVPTGYVKEQLDGVITSSIVYMRGEVDNPQVFLELRGPLERTRHLSLDYVNQRIQSLPMTYPPTADKYADDARVLIQQMGGGEAPTHIPSLANLPPSDLENALDKVLPVVDTLDPKAAASLEAHWAEIRALALQEPESREPFKLAARAVVLPYIEVSIDEVRAHLDGQDRFDLVEAAAEGSGMTRQEFLMDADTIRDPINAVRRVGPGVALAMMVVATLLLAIAQLPHRGAMILWPSITLVITGLFAFILSLLMPAIIPNASYQVCGDAPYYVCAPLVDVLQASAQAMSQWPVLPSIAAMAIGAAGILLATLTPAGNTPDSLKRPSTTK